MEMTSKQRLLAAICGKEVDHIPFSPFLAYYFDFLPETERAKGELQYLKEMGADPLLRGAVTAYQVRPNNCTVSQKTQGNKRYETIHTPKGDLCSEYTYVSQANTWFLTRHPVVDAEQIPAAIAYYEDLQVIENIKAANAAVDALGEDGLQLALVGTNWKSAYQHLLENFVGTENLVYLTMDEPELLEELLAVMRRKNMETVRYTAESKAAACISWEDSSTTNLSPSLYETYIAPEIAEWCKVLGQAGKPYVQHACGHTKDLLLPMARQGVTAVESISPAPTGNVTMEEVFAVLPEHISVIGGIEPTQMLNASVKELLEYADRLIHLSGKHGFVLANSDSCPPGVDYEKFVQLAQFVKNRR